MWDVWVKNLADGSCICVASGVSRKKSKKIVAYWSSGYFVACEVPTGVEPVLVWF